MGNAGSKRQLNKVLSKPIPPTQIPKPSVKTQVEQEISKSNLEILNNLKITDVKMNMAKSDHLDILKSRQNQKDTGITVDTFDYKNSKYYNLPVLEGERVVWK